MELLLLVFIVLLLILFISLYAQYVAVIKAKNSFLEAESGIDVQLKKRHDLIPNILTIAKKFMEHEKGLFEEITKLRTNASTASGQEKYKLENELQTKMQQLLVSVENYPQLKSDQPMIQAMQTYNEVEEHISAARRFYNSALANFKNTVEIFPGSAIASMLNIKADMAFFEAQESEKAPVSASDFLN